ncbi:MAG: hypothetical protein Q9215_004091 [Flavoplaca cf. flavocitrina]
MSAATQKPLGELHPAVPTFSYAQAAKGRSPSGPSSVFMEKTPKEAETQLPKSAHVEDQDTTPTADKSPTKRAVSEGGLTQTHGLDRKPLGETQSPVHGASESSPTPATTTPATQASEKSQVVVSTPSSPEFGVTSSSTLLKDEDLFSNANASSDSTWEKLSQSSQNGSRPNDKVDQEKDITVNGYWDDETPTVPATAALKEAPPPPVNIWKQRAEAKAAKVPAKLSSSSPSAQLQLAVEANNTLTPFDIGAESRKHDSKKQTKRTHGSADEKSAAAGIKDAVKSTDERVKGHEITDREPQKNLRAGQVDKSVSNIMPPPPPPGDAQSWPTPDSAQDEEKKKASGRMEKGEKEKAPSARAHGKEKWTPVPYVPTVQFSTPIPSVRRGMRAPRGGRESTPRGALNADKTTAGSPDASTGSQTAATDHSKAEAGTSKNPTSTTKSKRASSAGPVSSRDSRKGGDMAAPEKRKDTNASTKQTDYSTTEARRASASTQDDFIRNGGNHTNISGPMPQAANGKFTRTPAGINNRVDAVDVQGQPRPVGPERRGEGDFRGTHQARDYHPPTSHRDRGEGRPDRGRGGYRSRGGSNSAFVHSNIPNGNTAQYPFIQPPMPSKSHSNHERHSSQLQNLSYPQGSHTHPTPQLTNLHTDVANTWGYQPGNQGAMSATPYNPYMEQVSIFGMVSMQMEYYFSVDNLCKDLYLRKHMDSQGFVFLPVLAKFNRIRQLTQDLELIRYVCLNSPQIEFRTGSDGHDRLRKREGWQQWILSMEDRDPSVQNDGPNQVHQPYFQHYPVFNDTQYGLEDSQNTRLSINGNSPHRTSDTMVRSPVSASPSKPSANGNMGTDIPAQTPLSAAVPDFTPRLSATSNAEPTVSEPRQSMENSFTDEQVDLLMIVVRKPLRTAAQMSPPFHTASSRTFSNGSIDGRTIASELTTHDESLVPPSVNGDGALDTSETRRTSRPLSPFPRDSPSRRTTGNVPPPVFWVKDKEIPIDSLPDDLTHEPYNVFRRNALMKRNTTSSGACHYDMDILYQFWSHFLIRNFNSRMYQEFRATAFEDAEKRGSNVGLKNLVQYHNESILSQKVISDQIANDFLELVAREGRNPERPAFDKLRAAWRNGAFNMKNRKKLDSIMDLSLKAELER